MSTAPSGWQTPKTNWLTSDPIAVGDLNRAEGNANATELGDRTLDQALAAPANIGTLRQILSWLAGRIRAITGATNWWDAPATTLADAHTHHGRANNPHVVTAQQTGAVRLIGDTMTGALNAPDVRWGAGNSRGVSLAGGTDLNTVTDAGWYDVLNALNRPTAIADWTHLIVSRGHSALWVQQIAFDYRSLRMWIRRAHEVGGVRTWTTWSEVWHSGRQGVGSGLDADSLRGWVPDTAATPHTVMQRTAVGNAEVWNTLRIVISRTPTSATAPGIRGEICWDTHFVYVCIADNFWRRAALTPW